MNYFWFKLDTRLTFICFSQQVILQYQHPITGTFSKYIHVYTYYIASEQ